VRLTVSLRERVGRAMGINQMRGLPNVEVQWKAPSERLTELLSSGFTYIGSTRKYTIQRTAQVDL
jgi:hypothetical protein